MKRNLFFHLNIFFFLLLFLSPLFADTIFLKNGREVTGKIVGRNEAEVTVDLGRGIYKTYEMEDIQKIDGPDRSMPFVFMSDLKIGYEKEKNSPELQSLEAGFQQYFDYLEKENYRAAITYLEQTLEISPNLEPQIYFGLMRCYYKLKEFDKALTYLKKVQDVRKESNFAIEFYFWRIYKKLGNKWAADMAHSRVKKFLREKKNIHSMFLLDVMEEIPAN